MKARISSRPRRSAYPKSCPKDTKVDGTASADHRLATASHRLGHGRREASVVTRGRRGSNCRWGLQFQVFEEGISF